jgi:hypothetical protein
MTSHDLHLHNLDGSASNDVREESRVLDDASIVPFLEGHVSMSSSSSSRPPRNNNQSQSARQYVLHIATGGMPRKFSQQRIYSMTRIRTRD